MNCQPGDIAMVYKAATFGCCGLECACYVGWFLTCRKVYPHPYLPNVSMWTFETTWPACEHCRAHGLYRVEVIGDSLLKPLKGEPLPGKERDDPIDRDNIGEIMRDVAKTLEEMGYS